MGFYSVICRARRTVVVPDRTIALGKGINTFNIETGDIDGVVEHLRAEGVEVDKVAQLDGLEPVDPNQSLLLPGEGPEALAPLLDASTSKA